MLGERLTTLLSLISQDEYKTVDEFCAKDEPEHKNPCGGCCRN